MLNVNDVNQIYLGCQGENLARTIIIDVKPWLVAYPGGTVAIWHKRNGAEEATATGAVFDSEAGTITWRPTGTDTYVFGEGEAEIRLTVGNVIKKSRTIKTDVAKAVTGADGEALESGWQGYLDAIQRAAGVAITKNGLIQFAVNSEGHLILSYTEDVPIPAEESDETTEEGDVIWIDKDLGKVTPTEEQVQTAANTYLETVITNPDSPPLDRTLSSNVSAAPADMVGDLKLAFDGLFDQNGVLKTVDKTSDVFTAYATAGYVGYSDGLFSSSASNQTYLLDVVHNTDIYFSDISRLVTLVIYNKHLSTLPTTSSAAAQSYVKGARSDKTGVNALPTPENKWTVTEGQMIAITVQTAPVGSFEFNFTDYSLLINNRLILNENQVDQVKNSMNIKKPGLQYVPVDTSALPNSYFKEEVDIYIPTTVGFIKFLFVRNELDSYNANNWRLDKAFAYTDGGSKRFLVVNSGEYEMALKIDGRDDFIGGIAHGDEVTDDITFLVDGNEIADITSITTLTKFDELKIVEKTLLYDPADGATLTTRSQFTPCAEHGKEYTFTKDGIKLRQFVKWLKAETLSASYMTMFPIVRGNDSVSELQITDTYYADEDYVLYDVSTIEGASGKAWTWRSDVNHAVIWSDESGVSAEVIMLKQPTIENAGARKFKVQDSSAYNKLYWSVCGVNYANYNASVNERFVTETLYKVNICK